MVSNPLLSISDLIDFPNILPKHVMPAMKELIDEAQKTLNTVTQPDTPATWDDVIVPLEKKTLALSRAWGAVSQKMRVRDEPEIS